MSEKHHIITHCSRPKNIPALAAMYLNSMACHPFAVRWHILLEGPEHDILGLNKINEALDMIQDGWVWIIDDATLHDRDVFNRLGHVVQENPNAAVVVFSQEHVLGHTLHAAP